MSHWRSREEAEAFFRRRMSEDVFSCPNDEGELANLLHVMFDKIDLKEELMKEFWCEEVVDYLLTFLDEKNVRTLLYAILTIGNLNICPIHALAAADIGVPYESKPDMLYKIAEIYQNNSMLHEFRAAMSTREYIINEIQHMQSPQLDDVEWRSWKTFEKDSLLD